jgi:hypothetical protein
MLKSITLEKIYLFYVILFAAQATLFTSDMDFRSNPVGVGLMLVLCTRLLIKHKISLQNKNLLILYAILGIWAVLHYLTDIEFKLLSYLILYINVTVGYSLVKIFGNKLYEKTTQYITYLTGISLVLWAIMHVTGTGFFESIGFMKPTSSTSSSSLLIFNVPNIHIYEGAGIGPFMRNCGFAWEPGLFASFVCFAIYFNLLIKKRIKGNRNFYILTLGLFSTFSTTGYSAFLLIMANYFIVQNAKKSTQILYIIVGIPTFLYIMNLPFMADKIKEENESENFLYDNNQIASDIESEGKAITVRRWEGIIMDYLNIQDRPILGYGTINNSYVNTHISPYLITSNGIIGTFARFGIILGLLINIAFIRNVNYIDRLFRQKYCVFYILFMILSVSYTFTTLALMIALCCSNLWINKPQKYIK